MNNRERINFIACILLCIDQIIKIIVNNFMTLYDEITIIPNFFSIFYVKNTGAAFSILEDNVTLLIAITVIFILLFNRFIKDIKEFNKLTIASYSLLLGGMFGNLIDRIIHKGVIDYLSFEFFNYSFPVFNFADICITTGVVLLLIEMLLEKKEKRK